MHNHVTHFQVKWHIKVGGALKSTHLSRIFPKTSATKEKEIRPVLISGSLESRIEYINIKPCDHRWRTWDAAQCELDVIRLYRNWSRAITNINPTHLPIYSSYPQQHGVKMYKGWMEWKFQQHTSLQINKSLWSFIALVFMFLFTYLLTCLFAYILDRLCVYLLTTLL